VKTTTDVRGLLNVLQSRYPVAAVAPQPQLLVDIAASPDGLAQTDQQRLSLVAQLRSAVNFFLKHPEKHPQLRRLLGSIAAMAAAPGQKEFNPVPLEPPYQGTDEFFYSGCWYPKNPPIRKVPLYAACASLTSASANKVVHKGHNLTTPGLFLVFCHEHDELIGFHLLKYSESTRTVHDLMLSRYKLAPRIVIYDHACDLHKYSIAREPKFFADTAYYVDKLHYGTHKDCSCAYDPFKPQHLRSVNTTIYEQANSRIKHTRKSMYHMTQEHFLFILRHILYMLKREKNARQMKWSDVLRRV
jgi:hypothetical protein